MRRRIGPPAMQIAIFKQPWRIKVKETLGVGHHYCPLRRSIPQPRDVNAIEQLRTAREATTIDSCGYRCAGGQCAQPGTAYRRSRPDCGLLLKLESFSKSGRLLGESLVCTSSAAARSVLCRLRWGFFISRQQRRQLAPALDSFYVNKT